MKMLASLVALLGLGLFTVGCSPEDQLQDAQEDFAEERQETGEAIGGAMADGVVTPEQSQDIAEEQAEDVQAAGEVIQQEGELLEDRVDN
jgi:PBP1b-binding outer membrane lipoprotein LpoB